MIKKSVGAFIACAFFAQGELYAQNPATKSALPEWGDSAERLLSPAEEKQLGRSFQRGLLRHPQYIGDPQIRDYINTLGRHIAKHADLRGLTPEFNVVHSTTLNAFAVPGGFITFHSGLILATENESELASVVAHEIAHVAQRHLARLEEKNAHNSLKAAGGIIGSILLGGDFVIPGIILSEAKGQSDALSFTRDFEREADALAVQYMAASGQAVTAIPGFLNKIERNTRSQEEQNREYLRTHPLSYARIAEVESLIANLPKRMPPENLDYLLVRAKIRVNFAERHDLPELKRRFDNILKDEASALQKVAAHYALALLHTRMREFAEARARLDALPEAHQMQLGVQVAYAEIDTAAGEHRAAAARYQALFDAHPEKTFLVYTLADALIAAREPSDAKRILRYQLRRRPNDFRLYPPLARANVALGKIAEAHQADAEYLAMLGDYKPAAAALKRALREVEPDSYLSRTLDARYAELEREFQIAERQKKR